MKKLKKLLVGILSVAMAISTMAFTGITCFAADSAIDESRKGSLTIYPYLYDGVTSYQTGFYVWKIADIVQITEDDGTTRIEYKVTDAARAWMPEEYMDASSGYLKDYVADNNTSGIASALYEAVGKSSQIYDVSMGIGLSGHGTYSNAPLGIYLVGPRDDRMAPFLVSVPTKDSAGKWQYDVSVSSKIQSSLTVCMYGKAAGVNEETAGNTTPLEGAEFYLQEQSGTGWVTMTETYTTGADGSVKIEDPAPGTYRLVEKSAPDGYIVKSNVSYEFTVQSDGTIVGSDGTTQIDSFQVINEHPAIETKVLTKGSTTDAVNMADYSVGDKVDFQVTVTIPDNIEDLDTYTVKDTLSEGVLKFNDDLSFAYYDKDGAVISGASGITDAVKTYALTKDDSSWAVNFTEKSGTINVAKDLADAGVKKIVLTYSAEVLPGAATAGVGNANNVSLEYTNQVYADSNSDPDNPVKETQDPSVITSTASAYVLTFGIELNQQFDGVTDGTKKATFDLYRMAADSDAAADKTTIKGVDDQVVLVGTYTTDADGKIVLDSSTGAGFSNGTYYFVETATEKGYNLLADPVKVEVAVYYTVSTANGQAVVTYYSDAGKTTAITDTTTKVTVDNKSESISGDDDPSNNPDDEGSPNNSGDEGSPNSSGDAGSSNGVGDDGSPSNAGENGSSNNAGDAGSSNSSGDNNSSNNNSNNSSNSNSNNNDTTAQTIDASSPSTGDCINGSLWGALLMFSGLVLVFIAVMLSERRNRRI